MTCQRGSHILTPGVYACSTVIPTVTDPSRVQGDWEELQSSVMQTVPVTDSAQSGWNSFCTLNIPATSQVAHEPIENTSEAGPTLTSGSSWNNCASQLQGNLDVVPARSQTMPGNSSLVPQGKHKLPNPGSSSILAGNSRNQESFVKASFSI